MLNAFIERIMDHKYKHRYAIRWNEVIKVIQ